MKLSNLWWHWWWGGRTCSKSFLLPTRSLGDWQKTNGTSVIWLSRRAWSSNYRSVDGGTFYIVFVYGPYEARGCLGQTTPDVGDPGTVSSATHVSRLSVHLCEGNTKKLPCVDWREFWWFSCKIANEINDGIRPASWHFGLISRNCYKITGASPVINNERYSYEVEFLRLVYPVSECSLQQKRGFW